MNWSLVKLSFDRYEVRFLKVHDRERSLEANYPRRYTKRPPGDCT